MDRMLLSFVSFMFSFFLQTTIDKTIIRMFTSMVSKSAMQHVAIVSSATQPVTIVVSCDVQKITLILCLNLKLNLNNERHQMLIEMQLGKLYFQN
jgi:hypothetical protein